MFRKITVGFVLLAFTGIGKIYGQTKVTLLQRLFDSLDASHAFNGVVLVSDSGEIVFERAYGYADFEHQVPMSPETRFEIASVSKQFTAMAIMQLHQKGKLNYEDPLTKYFPDLPYKNVTIRELIHHSSGIPEFLGWTAQQMGGSKAVYTNHEIEERLGTIAPATQFEPGTRFSYSNTNYLLLADIVSKITSLPFAQYMQRFIFQKAGMTRTSIPIASGNIKVAPASQSDLANNYLWDPVTDQYRPISEVTAADYRHFMGGIYGPAGIKSTARDLFKWTKALRMGRLVADSTFEAAVQQPQLANNGKDTLGYSHMPYTFGWLMAKDKYVKDDKSAKIAKGGTEDNIFLWHNGGFGGYRSIIAFYPALNRSIIILENTDQTVSPDNLLPAVSRIMSGDKSIHWPKFQKIRKTIAVDSNYLIQLTGTYSLPLQPEIKMVVTANGSRLYGKYIDQAKAELYPYANNQFFFLVADAQVRFIKNNGNYTELVLTQNGRELHFIKR